MKVFFAFLIGCIVLGALDWRGPEWRKTTILLVFCTGLCAIYFLFNQI